jgi:hypothetical protein
MAESDEPSLSRRRDWATLDPASREFEVRRWWKEADKSLRLLALLGYLTKHLVYIVGFGENAVLRERYRSCR